MSSFTPISRNLLARRHRLVTAPLTRVMSTDNSKKVIEVEEKFVLTEETNDMVESKLQELGLAQKGDAIVMVDWYYDLETPTLALSDDWLRYRDTPKGARWELKQGLPVDDGATDSYSTGTVYAEFAGDTAVQRALDLLEYLPTVPKREGVSVLTLDYAGHNLPQLPGSSAASGLVPFARIETTRSSWMYSATDIDTMPPLAVDLDRTDFGYRVGEVEIVVADRQDVVAARQEIATFLRQLIPSSNGNGGNSQPPGKLELYLMNRRPDIYHACVKAGSMVVANKA